MHAATVLVDTETKPKTRIASLRPSTDPSRLGSVASRQVV